MAKTAFLKKAFTEKHSKFRILGVFLLSIIIFYVFWNTSFFQENILAPWTRFNAWVAAGILWILGQGTSSAGDVISSSGFSISIKKGCDALEPVGLFVAGLLAYPTLVKNKLLGIPFGIVTLLLINFFRIISLFLIGKYWNSAFEFFHVEFWQVTFILLALALLWLWIRWSDKREHAKVSSGNVVDSQDKKGEKDS